MTPLPHHHHHPLKNSLFVQVLAYPGRIQLFVKPQLETSALSIRDCNEFFYVWYCYKATYSLNETIYKLSKMKRSGKKIFQPTHNDKLYIQSLLWNERISVFKIIRVFLSLKAFHCHIWHTQMRLFIMNYTSFCYTGERLSTLLFGIIDIILD